MYKPKTVGELEEQARVMLGQLRADEREIDLFLSEDHEDADAAAFLIGARVGHKLNSTTKAHATTALLNGLRSEIVNLRGLAEEMRGLALDAGRSA